MGGWEYLGYVECYHSQRVTLSHHSLPQLPAQPGHQEGEQRAEVGLLRVGFTEQGTVCLPADVEGEAVDVTVPALSAQHPHHGHLGMGGVGVAGVLGPGRHVGDEVGGVVVGPLGDTLVTAALPQSRMTGSPGHVSPVVLPAPQLDGVGQAALTARLPGHLGLPGVRPHRQAEVGLGDADTEQPGQGTGRLRSACSYSYYQLRRGEGRRGEGKVSNASLREFQLNLLQCWSLVD